MVKKITLEDVAESMHKVDFYSPDRIYNCFKGMTGELHVINSVLPMLGNNRRIVAHCGVEQEVHPLSEAEITKVAAEDATVICKMCRDVCKIYLQPKHRPLTVSTRKRRKFNYGK